MSIIFDPQQEFRIPHPRDPDAYFLARPLTHRERLALAAAQPVHTPAQASQLTVEEQAALVSEQFERVVAPTCRKAVTGWGGFLGPDGQPVRFRSEYLERLELDVLQAICSAVLEKSTVTPEEAGESQ